MTLTVLRGTGQGYCRVTCYWNLSDVFLMIGLVLGVLRKKITEVKCLFHHILSRLHTMNMTYHVDIDLDHLLEVVFV